MGECAGVTRSEELISRALTVARETTDSEAAKVLVEIAGEYQIAIVQGLNMEGWIHTLCKRIEGLPSAK